MKKDWFSYYSGGSAVAVLVCAGICEMSPFSLAYLIAGWTLVAIAMLYMAVIIGAILVILLEPIFARIGRWVS